MSLAETQEIMGLLQQIMAMLDGVDLKTEKVTRNIGFNASSGGTSSLRRELHVLNMYTIALQKWSGNDTLAGIMNGIQEIIQVTTRLYMLALAINALAAGPTPFGLLYLGANAIGFAVTLNTLGQ